MNKIYKFFSMIHICFKTVMKEEYVRHDTADDASKLSPYRYSTEGDVVNEHLNSQEVTGHRRVDEAESGLENWAKIYIST